MFNINIYGDKNIVTCGEQASSLIYQGEPADIASLIEYIANIGIDKKRILML